jgi:hypothetical protein
MQKLIGTLFLLFSSSFIHANNLQYEQLSANTQTITFHEKSDQAASYIEYAAVADSVT